MPTDAHIPQLRDIDSPGLISLLLFENPWILAGLLAIGAISLFVVFNNRRKLRLGAAFAGVFALGAITVMLLAMLVTTDREQVKNLSRELIAAVADADAQPVEQILSPFATLVAEGALRSELSRDEILDRIRDASSNGGAYDGQGTRVAADEYRIREIRVGIQSSTAARSQVNVVITPSITSFPTGTWWELDWDKLPDGSWKARRIELVWVAGMRSIGPR